MKYYKLLQDKRMRNVVMLKDFLTNEQADFDSSMADKVKDNTMLYTIEKEESGYPDVLEAPLFMLSEKAYEVVAMYDENAIFKKVSLINIKSNCRRSYRVGLIDRIDCLHEDSKFYKDNSVETLILDQEKLTGKEIFKVKGISPNWVIVSLNIVESLIRRNVYGMQFEEVIIR